MRPPPLNNSYALLAFFLSSWKNRETRAGLEKAMRQGRIDWEGLLFLANLHLCTPLWYVCLKSDKLLYRLPTELQAYLENIYLLNLGRNEAGKQELSRLLADFADHSIPAVLLKGAATFCDHLYGDPGARMMGDIDILVNPRDTRAVCAILRGRGYGKADNPELEVKDPAAASHHHHLPAFHRPGSRFPVEIHYKIISKQAGRLFPPAIQRERFVRTRLDGQPAYLLNPTERLIHNAGHALVQGMTFSRGLVSLQQLSDFSHLVQRYGPQISWPDWFNRGTEAGHGIEFRTYLHLANRLQGVEVPRDIPPLKRAKWHAARIVAAGKYISADNGRHQRKYERILGPLLKILVKVYYYMRLPAFVWGNTRYTVGSRCYPARIHHLMVKAVQARNWARITYR
ncbi:MAG: nucleotidyltransferase family protein [Desulfobacterales bacterium]|nr:nucleotidyltransferase family protein [Desulfobacterales bacterium]